MSNAKSFLPLLLVLILVAGGVYIFRGDSTMSSSSPSPTPEVSPVDSNQKVIEIEAGSFYYKPDEIRVKKGDNVKVVIRSVSMMHDFVIDELQVRTPIVKDGDTGSVEFVASQSGTFEYYCSVGQHRQNGQVGTIIIEE